MRIEAQAARLENAILDTRDREHREADRFCNATSSGIDWTRTKGAELYASVKAGQDAFKRGATSAEVVAAIYAAGAKSNVRYLHDSRFRGPRNTSFFVHS